ncbi:Uclacyanin 1 [Citrus sinensis]|nr:uclacyanin 1 [Citrus x clementina]XP_006469730.1 uclacyanin 1-like [Citrus sinensis]XP_024047382.1 uclacyanin 1 [Citrus x clementina]KAH9744593.1 Uclacyanin 1 [Citrus sinensis]
MAVLRTFICVAATAMLIQLSMAANYTVGGPNGGWDTATDLRTWATSQKFLVGDNLIFQYPSSHDVTEVSKPDYDSCQTSNKIQSYTDGNTVIPLSSPGKRYFICGAPGHCTVGMKVEIDALASTSPAPASPSKPPQASLAAPTPQASSKTPPPASPAPETSSPSPEESPKSAPTVSPASPSSSPLGSPPPSPDVPTADSPSTSPPPSGLSQPPQPSSAAKVVFKTIMAMGFSFGIMMLLAF